MKMSSLQAFGSSDQDVHRTDFHNQEHARVAVQNGVQHVHGHQFFNSAPTQANFLTLLESLRFEEIDARLQDIKNSHLHTCKWLLTSPEWIEWLDASKISQHRGLLWIKGKPGAGKSTLMKFAVRSAHGLFKDTVILSFFFHARGAALEKSTAGLYRYLLVSLLEQRPYVINGIKNANSRQYSLNKNWTVNTLEDMLTEAIQSLDESSVVCFIDALDECDDNEIRSMLSFFDRIGQLIIEQGSKVRFLFCFASRHYPHITTRYGLFLILEQQHGHFQDIAKYLDSKLNIGHTAEAEQIRGQMQEKAAGVFMWVVLVTAMLNKEYDRGHIHSLRQQLQNIPNDLHDLFKEILLRDTRDKDELLLCIQWVLFSESPLTPIELYFAIRTGVQKVPVAWNRMQISDDIIRRFITSCSKGLVEIASTRVQFIHESVRDFLFEESNILNTVCQDSPEVLRHGHEQLKHCCLKSLEINQLDDHSNAVSLKGSPSVVNSRALEIYPFLQCAVEQVLFHADAAEASGVSQKSFLETFNLQQWIALKNVILITKSTKRTSSNYNYHPSETTLLYILAEYDYCNLILRHPQRMSHHLELEPNRYGMPFMAAWASNNAKAKRCFIQSTKTEARWKSLGEETLLETRDSVIVGHWIVRPHYGPHYGRSWFFEKISSSRKYFLLAYITQWSTWGREQLHILANKPTLDPSLDVKNIVSLVNGLLRNRCDSSYPNPLTAAVKLNSHSTVKFIIRHHHSRVFESYDCVCFDKDRLGRSALSHAAVSFNVEVLRPMLDCGKFDVNERCSQGRTPLSYAACSSNPVSVRVLLARPDLDANTRSNDNSTPLAGAMFCNCIDATNPLVHEMSVAGIEILLGCSKVNVNQTYPQNFHGKLLRMSDDRNFGILPKLLSLRNDLNVNATDSSGYTILHLIVLSLIISQRHRCLLTTAKTAFEFTGDQMNTGFTAFMLACFYGRIDIMKVLLERPDLDPDAPSNDGTTPLLCTLWDYIGDAEVVIDLLLSTDRVDPLRRNVDGVSPYSTVLARCESGEKFAERILKKFNQYLEDSTYEIV